jgi:hypothetical protein
MGVDAVRVGLELGRRSWLDDRRLHPLVDFGNLGRLFVLALG